MSDFKEIVELYVNSKRTLEQTVDALLRLHIGHAEISQNYTDGTWTELDKMLNEGTLSFPQFRSIVNAYDQEARNLMFHILGQEYGFNPTLDSDIAST